MLPKKEFTSFDTAAVVKELKGAVVNSRVNNIYQLGPKTLLLKLRKADEPLIRLALEAGRRLHLTSYALEKPLLPPAFCMALRKYLRAGWLADVEQYEFERIVTFYFRTKSGMIRLILELFGEGNLILVNDNGKILQALAYKRMRDRNIVRNEIFQFPPSSGKNPFKVNKEELAGALVKLGDVEVVRGLTRFLSIGGVYAEEILLKANVEKSRHCNALSDSEVNAIFRSLQSLLLLIAEGKLEPCVILDEDGGFVDVVPFKLKRYEASESQPYGSFNEALDEFYSRITAVEKVTTGIKADELKREVERLGRIVAEQEKIIEDAQSRAEYYKRVGDTVYSHANELQGVLNKFLKAKEEGKDWNSVVREVSIEKKAGLKPSAFFESFDSKNFAVNVSLEGLRFSLNLHKTLFENATGFYEQSKRFKQKMAGARAALEETSKKLAEAEAKMKEATALERTKPAEAIEALTKQRVKRKDWFEKFRWFTSSDGFLVVAGKDAVSNEVLIKKYTEPHDIVFHTDITGAPFVVIKTQGKQPSEPCLREAGEFAAAFSRGWRENFGTADVYWIKPEQLSKSGPSGEYVPRGAFFVRGKRNWMRNVPLKVAIGVVEEENGSIKFVGGPAENVKTKTRIHVTIAPGEREGKTLLREVLKNLAAGIPKPLREKVQKASIETIREFIPYAKGRIIENRALKVSS
ncbi:MAG: ribosome rescue protein RqcH [Candidatus Bathycorpusculaceae bacterium]